MKRRVFLIVLDSFGIGALPDADEYGDEGSNTLRAVSKSKFFRAETLASLGLFQIDGVREWAHGLQKGISPRAACEKTADAYKAEVFPDTAYRKTKDEFQNEVLPNAAYGRMSEASKGKDTTTGHWEIAGIISETPFPTYPQGFPKELLEKFSAATGRGILCNRPYSGTQVIEDFGKEHLETGKLIVYTSADSVLQICGTEETFGLDELYRCCEIARQITMKDEWRVGRVIARPYVGKKKGEFRRTSNRHDYALKPFGKTALDALKSAGLDVISVGKIRDIFDGEGITRSYKSKSSVHGMEQTIALAQEDFHGLCFVNLVDFDALWGHRRDPEGYAAEIERFDVNLGRLLPLLREEDLLIITADHGNDPTYTGTDHTREKVPFLAWSPSMKGRGELPEADTSPVNAMVRALVSRSAVSARPASSALAALSA